MEKIINKYLKIIFLITIISSVMSAQDEAIVLSINNVNEINRTFDIIYTSSVDIYGFQFDISGVSIENVTDDIDGLVSFDNNEVFGMTLTQDVLSPAGNDIVLVSIGYEFDLDNTNICISNIVLGGYGFGDEYSAPDNCYDDLPWDGIGISFGDVLMVRLTA